MKIDVNANVESTDETSVRCSVTKDVVNPVFEVKSVAGDPVLKIRGRDGGVVVALYGHEVEQLREALAEE